MTDRNVQYPYRFHVRPVPGTDDICEIIPAPGAVYEDGTFWSKQNVLQDITAALYDKGPDATPDDIFAAISSQIESVQTEFSKKATVAAGTYIGTGSSMSLWFEFVPKLFFAFPLNNTSSYAGIMADTASIWFRTNQSYSAYVGYESKITVRNEHLVVISLGGLFDSGIRYAYVAVG